MLPRCGIALLPKGVLDKVGQSRIKSMDFLAKAKDLSMDAKDIEKSFL